MQKCLDEVAKETFENEPGAKIYRFWKTQGKDEFVCVEKYVLQSLFRPISQHDRMVPNLRPVLLEAWDEKEKAASSLPQQIIHFILTTGFQTDLQAVRLTRSIQAQITSGDGRISTCIRISSRVHLNFTHSTRRANLLEDLTGRKGILSMVRRG